MKKLMVAFIFGIIALCIGIKFNSIAMKSGESDKPDMNLANHVTSAFGLNLSNESVDNETPFPEILIQKLQEDYAEFDLPKINEKEMAALLKYFKELESILKDHINDPLISAYGGINYAMSLEEMKKAIKKTFKGMKQKGLIISESEFERIKDLYYTAHHHTDLTRIWGAEYLKKEISKSKELNGKYDVPDYIIVATNPNKIKVKLWSNRRFPVVGIIEDAIIYFKNIQGDPIGCDPEVQKDIGEGSVLRYTDICVGELTVFSLRQNDNVIKDRATGKRYIIDTEFTSFIIPPLGISFSLMYGSKKFQYYNHISLTHDRRKSPYPDDILEYEFELKERPGASSKTDK